MKKKKRKWKHVSKKKYINVLETFEKILKEEEEIYRDSTIDSKFFAMFHTNFIFNDKHSA